MDKYYNCTKESPSSTLGILYQDFKHSNASMMSLSRWFRRSVMVILALEKSRSGSADIAGIDRISIAIRLRLGNVLCCVGSSHQDIGLRERFVTVGVLRY